jgi:hypothetical protein
MVSDSVLIAMTIFGWASKVYFEQYSPPQNAVEVYVGWQAVDVEDSTLNRSARN